MSQLLQLDQMKYLKTLSEAKKELAKRQSFGGVKIWNRKKSKWRTKAQKARISRPYFVGTFIEWINL